MNQRTDISKNVHRMFIIAFIEKKKTKNDPNVKTRKTEKYQYVYISISISTYTGECYKA